MSNYKQSSVDFLIENLHLQHSTIWAEIINNAKLLRELEIRSAYNDGKVSVLNKTNLTSEEYYENIQNND